MGNICKKGKNMKGIITLSIFTRWFFNQTLSIYVIPFTLLLGCSSILLERTDKRGKLDLRLTSLYD